MTQLATIGADLSAGADQIAVSVWSIPARGHPPVLEALYEFPADERGALDAESFRAVARAFYLNRYWRRPARPR